MKEEELKLEVIELREMIRKASIQLAKIEKILAEEEKEQGIPILTEEELELAEKIERQNLELGARAISCLRFAGIYNLKEMYEYAQKYSGFENIRNVGHNTNEEIMSKIMNIKDVIQKLTYERNLIEVKDGPIELFFDEESVKILKRRRCYTLKQLYYRCYRNSWKEKFSDEDMRRKINELFENIF